MYMLILLSLINGYAVPVQIENYYPTLETCEWAGSFYVADDNDITFYLCEPFPKSLTPSGVPPP